MAEFKLGGVIVVYWALGVSVGVSLWLGWLAWSLGRQRAHAVELASRTSEDLDSTLGALPDVLLELGLDGYCYKCRTAHSELLGVPAGFFKGKLLGDVLPQRAAAVILEALQQAHTQDLSSGLELELPVGDSVRHFELSVGRKSGSRTQDPRFIMILRDISLSKENESRLEKIAHHDTLTGLPNRMLLADRLRQGILQSQRRGKSLAVAYLDLDGFKAVNDTHGHDHGDQLLMALAARMKLALRETDTLSRIGGDEFVAVLVDLEQPKDYEVVLQRLLQAASEPVVFGDVVMQVSASIGVTVFPQDGADTDADLLMRHADHAMYSAKQLGKNRFHAFEAHPVNPDHERQKALMLVREALDQNQFELFYQPRVNLASGQITGAEALIRWHHPQRGFLVPFDFLDMLEKHPISEELGAWVVEAALKQLDAWRSVGVFLPVSINVSATQLDDADFVHRIRTLLSAYPQVPVGCIEFELLENAALKSISRVIDVISEFRQLGVRVALDDFGTGYSSLSSLKRMQVDALKMDQSHVRGMLEDRGNLVIVKAVIGLAKAFGVEVIAEGVETAAHGAMLLSLGCQQAQGYGIAKPMPAGDLPAWIDGWHEGAAWTVWRRELPKISHFNDMQGVCQS